ncbi:MAG: DegV family protein [Lachnospiraceae bacterium]|nr:DegV family protein [Lachnospiraceae bacterium]
MSIQIITDSASDLTQAEAKQLNITVLPLTVTFGETSYRDGIDIDHKTFFEKLIETDELPVTSQLPPYSYEQAFRAAAEQGDTVICLCVSSKLSGCYQSANIAASSVDGDIRIVDTLNVTIGERILVDLAVRCRDQGMSADEIVRILEAEKANVRLIALLDTLEYLKKGGRISATAAFAGTLLNVKPVIAIEDGLVKQLGKARGSRNGSNMLNNMVKKDRIDFSKPLHLAYSGLSDAMLVKYVADSKDLYHCQPEELPCCTIGSVIGTHVGPGAIACAYFTAPEQA